MSLAGEARKLILDPTRNTARSLVLMGPLERLSISRFQNPLPLAQNALLVAPHIVSPVAATAVCFAVCYAVFMRQELRST